MTPEAFQDLAFRALENPSDAMVWAELDEVLRQHPDWREKWMQLAAAYAQAEEIFPAQAAAETSPEATGGGGEVETIPAPRLDELRKLISPDRKPIEKTNSAGGLWAWIGGMAAALILGWWAWGPSGSMTTAPTDLVAWHDTGPASLQLALTAPLEEVLRDAAIPVQRGVDRPLILRSPLVAAVAGPVQIEWSRATVAPAKTTVILSQGTQEIWRTTTDDVRVTTPSLRSDEVYALELQVDGIARLRDEFVTVGKVGATDLRLSGDLDRILDAAIASPARLGEAVLAWWALPPEVRSSENGLRVGAWLAVEARQPDMLAEVRRGKRGAGKGSNALSKVLSLHRRLFSLHEKRDPSLPYPWLDRCFQHASRAEKRIPNRHSPAKLGTP